MKNPTYPTAFRVVSNLLMIFLVCIGAAKIVIGTAWMAFTVFSTGQASPQIVDENFGLSWQIIQSGFVMSAIGFVLERVSNPKI